MYNLPPRWLHNGVALWSLNVKSYRLHSFSRLWSHQRHSRESGNLTVIDAMVKVEGICSEFIKKVPKSSFFT